MYVVGPLDVTGRERVLHRNLLLPCPYLVEEQRTPDVRLERKGCQRNSSKQGAQPRRNTHHESTDSSSDEEVDLWVPMQRAGTYLDPCAAEFHPGREERNRKPEKETDIEEIVDESVNIPDSDKSDEEVLGDLQGEQELEERFVGEAEHEDSDLASEPIRRTSARTRQPRNLYTYDTLGEPTLRPVNWSVCGGNTDVRTCCVQPQLSIDHLNLYPSY